MKKAILYDLDHTLFDPKTLDKGIFQPAFDILKNDEQCSKYDFLELKKEFFSISLNAFIKKYIGEHIKQRFIASLRTIGPFPELKTYKDSFLVTKFNTKNYLITSGLREFQNQKIDSLKIRDWFTEIYIDDPIEPKWSNKEEITKLIMKKYNYEASDLLVVGDNPESEIKAGNNIGIETIQILREGIIPSEKAKYRINSLEELHPYILQK